MRPYSILLVPDMPHIFPERVVSYSSSEVTWNPLLHVCSHPYLMVQCSVEDQGSVPVNLFGPMHPWPHVG